MSSARCGTRATELARVLVIDDEDGARMQVELALVGWAAQVVGEAANGMRGAELAEQLQPDVIVLDLWMPVMDGFEALPLLRRVCPCAAVLVRSGVVTSDVCDRAMELGASDYLPKFMDPAELASRITVAARTARRKRERATRRSPRLAYARH